MKYIDTAFWKMALGFMIIVIFGLVCIYALSAYRAPIEASNLTVGSLFGKVLA